MFDNIESKLTDALMSMSKEDIMGKASVHWTRSLQSIGSGEFTVSPPSDDQGIMDMIDKNGNRVVSFTLTPNGGAVVELRTRSSVHDSKVFSTFMKEIVDKDICLRYRGALLRIWDGSWDLITLAIFVFINSVDRVYTDLYERSLMSATNGKAPSSDVVSSAESAVSKMEARKEIEAALEAASKGTQQGDTSPRAIIEKATKSYSSYVGEFKREKKYYNMWLDGIETLIKLAEREWDSSMSLIDKATWADRKVHWLANNVACEMDPAFEGVDEDF